jgi:hypothetical protein
VRVSVRVRVGVAVRVAVRVGLALRVGVGVLVLVIVRVAVGVRFAVGVRTGLGVRVGVSATAADALAIAHSSANAIAGMLWRACIRTRSVSNSHSARARAYNRPRRAPAAEPCGSRSTLATESL